MTVVDSVSKRVHFIPMHTTVTVEEVARLFLHHVWKLHSLPKRVVSDRGPQFVASFTKELYRLLGIRLSSSIAWHPQTDGQMECVNKFTERMKSATEEAKSAICKAQEDMMRYYNQRRTLAPVYKPGDQVYLDASDIKTTRLSLKLSHR